MNRLKQNCQGVAMVEFAIVAPVFFLAMAFIFEFSSFMFQSMVLEGAMQDAVRIAKVSVEPSQQADAVRQLLADRSFGLMDPAKIFITTDVAVDPGQPWVTDQCVNPGQQCPCVPYIDNNPHAGCDGPAPPLELGGPGDVREMRVFYQRPLLLPYAGYITARGTQFPISSAILIRNEP